MSQSAVNEKAGARTPLALVFASCAIGVVLLFLTGLMSNLPQPVLAAVVLDGGQGSDPPQGAAPLLSRQQAGVQRRHGRRRRRAAFRHIEGYPAGGDLSILLR
jgi:hypothetical protein